ncbi:probable serine/threonine-protein kinase PIX13 isoform X2 [Punica granatum]|uniref:Probable serine/threonine-protein kinase PIX13 isoform X2 n=1 Tax=Punica granatum TaxID=22663 RepID=A0A6P8DTY6_PUNGR|nr:probable serine/threonine-protein kinase PIX13 isoform X2 [Punica granatum]
MGICWGAPHYPTPSFTGYLRPGHESLVYSSSTSSSYDEETRSLGGISVESVPNREIVPTHDVRVFTLAELQEVTRNFWPDSLLGGGGFGRVFKGYLSGEGSSHGRGRIPIAVKKCHPESVQSEVTFLGSLSRPNIVRLLGYCSEEENRLLIYEYMSKDTLKNHLFRRGAREPLSWILRLKIAIGAAKGLAYLHQLEDQIICRDFKPSNILPDRDFNAKISDFGLATRVPADDRKHVSKQVLGTYGYTAPEYIAAGHLYAKSNVYSFGVVLLEILTGKQPHDHSQPSGKHFVVEWVRPYVSRRKLARVVDPQLEGRYPLKAALKLAQLAFHCLQMDPESRPSMDEVLRKLEKIATYKPIPGIVGPSSHNRSTRQG